MSSFYSKVVRISLYRVAVLGLFSVQIYKNFSLVNGYEISIYKIKNYEMAFFETLQDIFQKYPLPINLMKREKEKRKFFSLDAFS